MLYSGEKKKSCFGQEPWLSNLLCDSLNLHCFPCLVILSSGTVRSRRESIPHNCTCFQRTSCEALQDDIFKPLVQVRWILFFCNPVLSFCLSYTQLSACDALHNCYSCRWHFYSGAGYETKFPVLLETWQKSVFQWKIFNFFCKPNRYL